MPNFPNEKSSRSGTPSFSSSLLDAIYRSIDESQETRIKKSRNLILEDGETIRRAIMDTIPRKSRPYISTSSSSDSSSDPDELSKSRNSRKKSKAMEIYGNLKKMKQPVSPGRRLTNFLNSLFNMKNSKLEAFNLLKKSRSVKETTMHSRSNSKRSVRFHPVTCIYEDDRKLVGNKFVFENHEDDDMSCSSSDLFELENLKMIGVHEELPVYGTTNVGTNQAIANHLI